MHVGLPNDITHQLEVDYGRIKIIQRCRNDNTTRYTICHRCNYESKAKGGTKHLQGKRNSLQLHRDLKRRRCTKHIEISDQ